VLKKQKCRTYLISNTKLDKLGMAFIDWRSYRNSNNEYAVDLARLISLGYFTEAIFPFISRRLACNKGSV
jgi:hypothetical protein